MRAKNRAQLAKCLILCVYTIETIDTMLTVDTMLPIDTMLTIDTMLLWQAEITVDEPRSERNRAVGKNL